MTRNDHGCKQDGIERLRARQAETPQASSINKMAGVGQVRVGNLAMGWSAEAQRCSFSLHVAFLETCKDHRVRPLAGSWRGVVACLRVARAWPGHGDG
eukprot:scaffold1850_cov194-Pinguiococcus_pyrenoidosus.AAC.8